MLFYDKITNGRLHNLTRFMSIIRQFDGQSVLIRVTRGGKRSNKQNRYYFGYVVEAVRELFLEHGTQCTSEEVHEYLKKHVGKLTKTITTPDGEEKEIPISSSNLSTEEWENWMQQIRAWAANYGCYINLPNE